MKKSVITAVLFLAAISSGFASEIICKRDIWSTKQKYMFYENGKKIAVHTTECSGEEKYSANTINGRVKFIDKVNGPVYDATYTYLVFKNNKIVDGVYTEYYSGGKGAPKAAGSWRSKNGYPDGTVKYYYKSGKLLSVSKFRNKKITGKVKRYYETGALYSEETYSKDNTSGELRQYHPDGKLKQVTKAKDCKSAGTEYYDREGKKINFAARAAAAGAIPALLALISIYLAGFAFVKMFSASKPKVSASGEGVEISPDRRVRKFWVFLSLVSSFVPWAVLMAGFVYYIFRFSSGEELNLNSGIVFFGAGLAFAAVLLAWYFLTNLDGKEYVYIKDGVLNVGSTWAGIKKMKKIQVADIVKIHPVVIEKFSGEQYYGTSDIKQAAAPDAYTTYMCVNLKNDDLFIFAKYLDKTESDKLVEFLSAGLPGLMGEGA